MSLLCCAWSRCKGQTSMLCRAGHLVRHVLASTVKVGPPCLPPCRHLRALELAQMGIVEIHTWNATAEDVERPNRLVWDLDPGPDVTWKQVVAAATVVRDVLATLGMTSWVKTTGSRGLHVVVPLKPRRTVAACLSDQESSVASFAAVTHMSR